MKPQKKKRQTGKSNRTSNKMRRRFFDYASATPVRDEVIKVIRTHTLHAHANPSALYREGVEARKIIEEARKDISDAINAQPSEIVFTGSGTEADNLAIFGVVESTRAEVSKPHVIVSAFEHPAVLEAAKKLCNQGVSVSIAPVNSEGNIDPLTIRSLLTPRTVLVSVMYANNEIGTVQDIRGIVREVRHYRKHKKKQKQFPYVHTDCGQAALYCDVAVNRLGVDLMTLDGAKIYGPKGVGALYVKNGTSLSAQIVGGGQERGLRSGTENTPSIAGFACALRLARQESETESDRLIRLRDLLLKKINSFAESSVLNGSTENRLPNLINVCFPDQDSEYLVLKLDARGFAVSSSSSCRTLSENNSSYVIRALSKKHPCDTSSLRISFGRGTIESDVNELSKALKDALYNP